VNGFCGVIFVSSAGVPGKEMVKSPPGPVNVFHVSCALNSGVNIVRSIRRRMLIEA
jgi:hypothetical protein